MKLAPRLVASLVASLLAAAVAGAAPSIAPLPQRLSETGYGAPDATPFAPRYPLWTDGASKRRWIALPRGTSIDKSDADAWDFPRGTKLWKEFAFDGRAVETRMIERLADGSWRFATYVWSADGRDAELAPERGLRALPVAGAPNGRYVVPSRSDCLACHEGPAVPVLGYSAVQLETALSPALGYLHGNCGHCHNASKAVAAVDMVLAQSARDPATSAAATRASALARADRIVERLRSTNPYTRMPPLGVQVVDDAGAALVEAWIRSPSKENLP